MRTDNLNKKYASIPADMFEPVNKDKQIFDQRIETKPVGYLMDAWRRFKKNKGSVVAAVIILLLLLFAIIAPFCTPYQMDEADGYYKQARPKVPSQNNTGSGFWDGTYVKNQPYQDYINFIGIGIGSMYDGTDKPFDWNAVEECEYNPIKKLLKSYQQELTIEGKKVIQDRFEYRIDSYYEVGFISVEGLTMEEYENILAWEQETGKKVIFPIIDTTNEDAFNKNNLNEVYQENFWYRHDKNNNPIDADDNVLTLEQIKENGLVPNYRYGYVDAEDGKFIFDGENYCSVEGLSTAELLEKAVIVSPFKVDAKGEYAYKDGEYVLASTLTPEEQATNTTRYKYNYVSATAKDGEYVFYGDQYKKVAELTTEQLKSAYARYSASFTPTSNKKDAKYILMDGEYITFEEYQEKTGKGLMAWDSITEKYMATYSYDANGKYVLVDQNYVAESSLSEAQKAALVKYYNLKWDSATPGTHIYGNGEYQSIAGLTDQEIVDMMPRYEHGLMMYKRTGAGGKNLTVRVLYYNYYQYINGREPMFIFGADSQGYDILVRLAQGARLSFILATCVAIINLIIGIFYGSIQGYYGGRTDMIMEYVSEILSGIPVIILVTLFRMHFVDTGKISQLGALILAFISTGWIGSAYSVRMQFYRFKGQEYVLAARTLGASDLRLITKHIFPNAVGTLVTGWAFVIPNIIFAETTYSYLGIINFNGMTITSLGTMLSNGQAAGIDRFPHIIFFPALILSLLMISFNLFGNGLRDAFNPSLRGSEG